VFEGWFFLAVASGVTFVVYPFEGIAGPCWRLHEAFDGFIFEDVLTRLTVDF